LIGNEKWKELGKVGNISTEPCLVPHARNARAHGEEQIAKVVRPIQRFGFLVAVLVDDARGIIAFPKSR
jgi:hypothetical protein